MLKPVCDICHKDIRNATNTPAHFCDRCRPFAEDFLKQQAVIYLDAKQVLEKTMDKFRNKFLQETVVPETKKQYLEVVAK